MVSTANDSALSFRAPAPDANEMYHFDGPIIPYDKAMCIGARDVDVKAFAPGQANLYQVIDGQLNVFDVAGKEYIAMGGEHL